MMVKGDDALPIQCNVADLAVDKGVARPRVFVLDTRDSTVWIDGSVSLATRRSTCAPSSRRRTSAR